VGYSHYWPWSCLEAVERSDRFYWRTRLDTLRYTPAGDTMLTSSVAVARECAATLDVRRVPPRDLVALARVYLAARDSTSAVRTMARRLAAAGPAPDSARAHVLHDIVDAYLEAKPPQLTLARSYAARLDTLTGVGVPFWQVSAHGLLAVYARRMGDDASVAREANAMIAISQQLEPRDRQELGSRLVQAYWYLADLAGSSAGSAQPAKMIMAKARVALDGVPGLERPLAVADSMAGYFGAPAPRVAADRWILPPEAAPDDTIHPRPGKLSIVAFGVSLETAPRFRRLRTVVPDTVDITFIHNSYGHFASRGPLSPEEEEEAVRAFFINELGSPGTMAVVVPRFVVLPDGRRIAARTRNELTYGTGMGVTIVVVDRRGFIRRVYSGMDPWTEIRIESALRSVQ
jgi:hypothetical protein